MTDHIARKTAINKRVQARYGELMREGRHGHYETMFRVVHEELARAEKVIEAARKTLGHWSVDAESIALVKALAEYDRPSAPLDGRPVSDPSPAPPDHPREAE